MSRRISCLLGLLVVIFAARFVVDHNSTSRIDPALVGDWHNESESWGMTLSADGTWNQYFLVFNCGIGSYPKPIRTWTVSGEGLQLRTIEPIWSNEGDVMWRLDYAFSRMRSVLQGESRVTTERYRKLADAQGEVWLVEVARETASEPDRLRRKLESTQFSPPPGASFELDQVVDIE